jgi:hypothetical protein
MDIPFDLTCWYLNARRVMELVGPDAISGRLSGATGLTGHLQKIAELVAEKDAVSAWLRSANPPPLGKLIAEDRLATGLVFTHYSNFAFKGLPAVHSAIERGGRAPLAAGYSKLQGWVPDGRMTFNFHHEHLTSQSSWSELSGQNRKFFLGLITEISGVTIEATPYLIANPIEGFGQQNPWGSHWFNGLETYIEMIDNFSRIRGIPARRSKPDLSQLRTIPEEAIKSAFAEIIGEPTVPKDWGGERSDLFSSNVQLDGRRISAAFAFKGPAQFKPMTLAQLGKNGDQIDRLFSEPADLFVLQHCHEITPPVRATMRAYAQQMGRLRLFCIIDGYDTKRILSAYGKCGFGATDHDIRVGLPMDSS